MSKEDGRRWNRKWSDRRETSNVSSLLQEQEALLAPGTALDLACGRGQNSIWLAHHGYATLGVDISRVALQAAQTAALRQGLGRRTLFVQADLDRWRPPPRAFDLVAVFRFLDRDLFAPLRQSVRPGGLLFYETRHHGIRTRIPDANPTYLLRRGELATVFGDWELLYYEEGAENAALVARRPAFA